MRACFKSFGVVFLTMCVFFLGYAFGLNDGRVEKQRVSRELAAAQYQLQASKQVLKSIEELISIQRDQTHFDANQKESSLVRYNR